MAISNGFGPMNILGGKNENQESKTDYDV